eukprot:366394-Chlamydomonas_euryale.AAC.10
MATAAACCAPSLAQTGSATACKNMPEGGGNRGLQGEALGVVLVERGGKSGGAGQVELSGYRAVLASRLGADGRSCCTRWELSVSSSVFRCGCVAHAFKRQGFGGSAGNRDWHVPKGMTWAVVHATCHMPQGMARAN